MTVSDRTYFAYANSIVAATAAAQHRRRAFVAPRMAKTRLLGVAFVLGAFVAGSGTADAQSVGAGADLSVAVDKYQWQVGSLGDNQPLTDKARYTLRNLAVQESVTYGDRKYGVNLIWDPTNTSKGVQFRRSGDKYAISVAGGGYLKYQRREYGPNLVWSEAPAYEWILQAAGGEPRAGASMSVYNLVEKDFLVYCPRTYGLNVAWSKDRNSSGDCKEWWDSWKNKLIEALGKKVTEAAVGGALSSARIRAPKSSER